MIPGKVVVVGGVAGGATAAARLRRLSEQVEITVIERGPYVSFANCGLPYHVGGEIAEREKLVLQSPQSFWDRHRIRVVTNTEAVRLHPEAKQVEVRPTGESTATSERLDYDALILSTGAAPLRPPIPGIDLPGLFTLRNIPDMDTIIAWIRQRSAQRAVVIGGGYIGLEMAEQLRHRGLHVSVVEVLPQVMAPLDAEMAAMLHQELRLNGVELYLGDGVAGFEAPMASSGAQAAMVTLKSGTRLPADVVILGLGVRPEVWLAKDAGIELGQLGGIRVSDRQRTNLPGIWAVGDAVEVRNGVTGAWSVVPLAGPANRQGRLAADDIMGHPSPAYRGTFGTAALRLFKLTAACTGANERALKQAGMAYEALHLHPGHHVGYFPGAKPIALKLLFSPDDGRVLGAQAVGEEGVDKRIDVLATAIQGRMTVDDVANLELCYAPPFGAAKDPVNLAAMIAQNIRAGMVKMAQWSEIAPGVDTPLVLDVRDAGERSMGAIPGSMHIPLNELRLRLGEVPRDRPLVVHCQSGQRSYYACRVLAQNGIEARNLSGSWLTWSRAQAAPEPNGL